MPEAVAEHRPAPREPAPPAPRRPPPAVRLSSPAGAAPSALPAAVREAVAAPGSGSPLAPEVAGPLGPHLGADLRPVRVHTDQRAAAASGALGARAFTWGTHVFLGAGERPTDLSVMAHELTHAVQQSAGPTVHLFGGPHGDLEHEAHQASASALRGQPFAVRGRTSGPRVQGLFGWVKRGIQAVGRAASAVVSAVAELGSAIIDRALNFVKEHARSIPGYDLLAFIIGRDPVTQDPVDRSAINLIRGLVGLVPGGAALFENLQRAGVIQRAGDWFSGEVAKLNLTWEYIRGLFAQAWDALSVSDFVSPGTVWDKLRGVFGPPLTRIKNFALSAGRKILEFVFEGALALAGGAAQEVLAIFRRIGDVFGLVVADPVRFFRNLLTAVKGGFDLFWKNILNHLRTALFDWLLGALRGALLLPARFDFQGILSVILQVLGLTYAALRGILVRIIGEPAVAFIEKAFDFLVTVATKGLTAAWEKIKEFASGLADSVIAAIRDWVARSVVGAAVTKLLTMFNPVGAIIQAVIGIYNTVMFFVERIRQIARLVRSILDSIESIARGNLSAAVQFVERTMANTLPVVLAFLARLIGLGDVSKPVRDIIARIQTAIANAIERVARWIADRVKSLLAGRQQPGVNAPDNAASAALGISPLPFSGGGESHRLLISTEGGHPRLLVASSSMNVDAYLAAIRPRVDGLPASDPQKPAVAAAFQNTLTLANNLSAELRTVVGPLPAPRARAPGVLLSRLQTLVSRLQEVLNLASHGIHSGSKSDPIPITWYKSIRRYGVIRLAIGGSTTTFFAHERKAVPAPARLEGISTGGVIRIGLDSANIPENILRTGKLLQKQQAGGSEAGRATGAVDDFRELLGALGYNWAGFAADHAHDLAFGGLDQFDNLWPLSSAANNAANQSYYQVVLIREGSNVRETTVRDLAGKWFVIIRIQ